MGRLLILFLLGGLAGWCLAPPAAGRKEEAAVPQAAPGRAAAKDGARGNLPRSPKDFDRWVKEQAAGFSPVTGYGDPYHARELSAWSLEELRVALEQGLEDPGVSREGGPARAALVAMLGEWAKRDPDAAWAWLSALPTGPTRVHLSGAIAAHWPEDRIEEGLELAMADVENFRSPNWAHYYRLLQLSAESAAKRGPLALDELVSRARKSGMQFPSSGLNFPPGFDFAGLTRAPFMAGQMALQGGSPGFVAEGWLRADVDAAVAGLNALDRQQGRTPGTQLFNGLNRASADQARRAGAAIGKLPLEEQREVFSSAGLNRFYAEPEVYRAMIEALPDGGVRSTANLAVAGQLLRSNKAPLALSFVAAASDPAERIANLEATLEEVGRSGSQSAVNGEDREEIRRILVSWQADEEQIGRILGKLR